MSALGLDTGFSAALAMRGFGVGLFMGLRHEGSEAGGRVIDLSAEREDRSARGAVSALETRLDLRGPEGPSPPLQISTIQPLPRMALTYKPTAGTPRAVPPAKQRAHVDVQDVGEIRPAYLLHHRTQLRTNSPQLERFWLQTFRLGRRGFRRCRSLSCRHSVSSLARHLSSVPASALAFLVAVRYLVAPLSDLGQMEAHSPGRGVCPPSNSTPI